MRGTLEQSLQARLIQILEIMKHLDGFAEFKALRRPLLGDERLYELIGTKSRPLSTLSRLARVGFGCLQRERIFERRDASSLSML
jgi:hypothetical protein